MKLVCMGCGKKFRTASKEPECPACGGSDVEIDYQRYFTWPVIRHVKRAALAD